MRKAPALPFEAFKYTGSKRSRSPDNNAPSNSLSPAAKPNASSPARPLAGPEAAASSRIKDPTNTSPLLSKLSKPTVINKTTTTSTAPIGVPTELLGNHPLRLIIVGHNPSAEAWKRGHYYANPNNWMWRILRETSLAPVDIISGCQDDYKMPELCGIGFTDVGSGVPGTDSTQFKSKHFEEWRQPFYDRLAAHMKRASENVEGCHCRKCGAPVIVAFSGKKQFQDLFLSSNSQKRKYINTSTTNNSTFENSVRMQATKPASIPLGKQSILPSGWPLPLDKTEVWVMTSTSGAAAMTREARYAPWNALAERIQHEPWPLNKKPTGDCSSGKL